MFTVILPILLITRGDKTEDNQNFLIATVNPWHQIPEETEIAQVVVTEITSSLNNESNQEQLSEKLLIESEGLISVVIGESKEPNKSVIQLAATVDETLAA